MEEKIEKKADEIFCSSCGAIIKKEAEICPKCGVRQKKPGVVSRKSSGLAVILSFLIPGLGQIYCGQIGKGVLMVILSFIFGLLSFILIGIPFYIILWVYSMYDAYKLAEKTNQEPNS